MASETRNSTAPNLATLLLIKGKMASTNRSHSDGNIPTPPPPAATGAYSNEKINYRQNLPEGGNPQVSNTMTVPTNTTEPPKVSRKTKQLEVELLDKKMEEIDRKQEQRTNEAIGTWKGFDSFNYGFNPEPGNIQSTPVPSISAKQQTPTSPPLPRKQTSPVKTPEKPVTEPLRQESPMKTPKKPVPEPLRQESPVKTPEKPVTEPLRQESPVKTPEKPVTEPLRQESPVKHPSPIPRTSSPKYADSPVKDQPRLKSPPKEEVRPVSPQKATEKQLPPSPAPPAPPPRARHSKATSAPSIEKVKEFKQEQPKSVPSKSPALITEEIIPISTIMSNPQPIEKNTQPVEKTSPSLPTDDHYKLFPDIKDKEVKKSRNAHKSIQRSMDRYRFHIW